MDFNCANKLTRLRPLHEWHKHHLRHGGKIFPTVASLKWFLRQNQEILVAKRVLLPGKGGRCTFVTTDFCNAVYELLFQETSGQLPSHDNQQVAG